jgi:anthranilate synthase component 2
MKVLFIDNFDSFTYNLVDDFNKRGCESIVYRADTNIEKIKEVVQENDCKLLVLSPGPGNPQGAGVSLEALDYFKDKMTIFGVCLGHQVITHFFGGTVAHAPSVMHGKPSMITHNNQSVFAGLENPLQVGRYHSLCSTLVPDCLEVTAEFEDVVMGIKHKEYDIHGVQFHPESILTPTGGSIIDNVLKISNSCV